MNWNKRMMGVSERMVSNNNKQDRNEESNQAIDHLDRTMQQRD